MASRFGLSNRRTMQLVAVIILAFIFIAAIVLFAALRQGSDDINVNVRLTTTPAAPVAVVATTPPTPTMAPSSTPVPTAAPAPTAPPPPTPTAVPAPPPPPTTAPAVPKAPPPPPTSAPAGQAGPAPAPPAPPPAAPPPAGGVPGVVATVPPLPTQQTQAAPPKPPAGAPPQPTAAPTPTRTAPASSGAGSVGSATQMQIAQGQEATLRCLGDRVTITVRPGTMPRPVTLSCRAGASGQAPNPPGPRLNEVLFTVEAEGLSELPTEVNLGVGYDDDDLEDLNEDRLTIAHLQNGQWQPAPKQALDAPNNFVSATITRLGTYTVYQRQ